MNSQKQNMLFVLLDDLGYSDLVYYRGELDTPNIDAMAYEGLSFKGMYNSSKYCHIRAVLIT